MKKIIAVAAALAFGAVSAFALDITVGARGNFNMGLGTTLTKDGETYLVDYQKAYFEMSGLSVDSWKEAGNLGGGFGVYANFGLMELGGGSLGVQPEIGMNFNNGWNVKSKLSYGPVSTDYEETVSFISLDIPVLVTYTYPVLDALSVGGGAGVYLSFPMKPTMSMKLDGEEMGDSDDDSTCKMNFGLAFDVNAGYKVGPGSIVLDVRYMLDLTPLTDSDGDEGILTRRMLTIGAGYQIKF